MDFNTTGQSKSLIHALTNPTNASNTIKIFQAFHASVY